MPKSLLQYQTLPLSTGSQTSFFREHSSSTKVARDFEGDVWLGTPLRILLQQPCLGLPDSVRNTTKSRIRLNEFDYITTLLTSSTGTVSVSAAIDKFVYDQSNWNRQGKDTTNASNEWRGCRPMALPLVLLRLLKTKGLSPHNDLRLPLVVLSSCLVFFLTT